MGVPQTQGSEALSKWSEDAEFKKRISDSVKHVMDPDSFISHTYAAFIADQDVMRCSPSSQLRAFYELAAMGLLVQLDQAALIVRGAKTDRPDVTVMPQWQGYKASMERHPSILEVQAELVHKEDEFRYEAGELLHRYDPFDEKREINGPGDIRGGYLKIIYADGRPPRYHFVTVKHIQKCQACAETQNVWKKWWKQQALKTLYRDGYARRVVPIDPLAAIFLKKIIDADDILLGNDPQRLTGGEAGDDRRTTAERVRGHLGLPDMGEPEAAPPEDEGDRGEPEKQDETDEVSIKHMEQLYSLVMSVVGCDKAQAVESLPPDIEKKAFSRLLNLLGDYNAEDKSISMTSWKKKVGLACSKKKKGEEAKQEEEKPEEKSGEED